MLWSGEPVEFHENVSYVCSSDDLYFQWDREMVEFNVTCRPGGQWDQPAEWPVCLHCENLSLQQTNMYGLGYGYHLLKANLRVNLS